MLRCVCMLGVLVCMLVSGDVMTLGDSDLRRETQFEKKLAVAQVMRMREASSQIFISALHSKC